MKYSIQSRLTNITIVLTVVSLILPIIYLTTIHLSKMNEEKEVYLRAISESISTKLSEDLIRSDIYSASKSISSICDELKIASCELISYDGESLFEFNAKNGKVSNSFEFPLVYAGNKVGSVLYKFDLPSLLDLLNEYFYGFIIYVAVFLVLVSFFMRRFIKRPFLDLKQAFGSLEDENLSESVEKVSLLSSPIKEIDELFDLIKNKFKRINEKEKENQKKAELIAIGELVKKIKHDLRNPVASLNNIVSSIPSLNEREKSMLRKSIERINGVAYEIINWQPKIAKIIETKDSDEEATLISGCIESVVSEINYQHKYSEKINITKVYEKGSHFLASNIPKSDLSSILSNLITNSIEAINGDEINIVVKLQDLSKEFLQISIEDNGIGISKEIQKKLFENGATFNKNHGNGLALYNAKKIIADLGGVIELDSQIGLGTTINIKLPKNSPPSWLCASLPISNLTTLHFVDDEEVQLNEWKNSNLISNLKDRDRSNIRFSSSFEEAVEAVEAESKNPDSVLLTDYDLKSSKGTGLDLIRLYKNKGQCVLVTSYFDDPMILKQAKTLGFKIIPKFISREISLKCIA